MDFKTMHPFQLIALAVFAVLAVAGLILFANYSGFGTNKDGSAGKVIIWGTLPSEGVEPGIQLLVRGRREYSGVKYVEKPAATFDTDLAEAIASGSGPDLIIISQEQLLSQKAKLSIITFKSLPERTYRDSFVPIFDLFLTGEGTYGIPLAVDPLVLYYNKSMLTSIGVAQAPQTWEAVTGLSSALTERAPDQTLSRSLVPFGEYENVTNARAIVSLLFLQAGSPLTRLTAGGVRSVLGGTSSGESYGVTPAESAMNFYTQFANPAKTVYSWNRALLESRQAFLGGYLALYPGFASEQPLLVAGNPNLEFDMAKIPQPQTLDARTTYGLGYAFAIPKSSPNGVGAFQVAMALSTKDIAPAMAKALSMAPALRSSLAPLSNEHYTPVYYPEALIAKGWLSPTPRVTDTIFGTMISNITTGRKDVPGALTAADQALDAAL